MTVWEMEGCSLSRLIRAKFQWHIIRKRYANIIIAYDFSMLSWMVWNIRMQRWITTNIITQYNTSPGLRSSFLTSPKSTVFLFCMSAGTYSFKSRIAIFISLRVSARNLLRGSRRKKIFFVWSGTWIQVLYCCNATLYLVDVVCATYH